MAKIACGEKDILLQDIGHGSCPKSTCAAWPHGAGQVQGWLLCVPSARDKGQSPSWTNIQGYLSRFGSVHDPAAAIPVLCSLPTPPHAHQHPCWACRGAVHDFTRDWCSWYCSWAGSMHASWKISCGESGLSEGNPPRLLLQTQPSIRKATGHVLPSPGSPLQQLRAGQPRACPPTLLRPHV